MWEILAEILGPIFENWPSRSDENNSLVGTSEFERETPAYWAKWGVALGLIVLVAYGVCWLWSGE
jgi:hypothetical protein